MKMKLNMFRDTAFFTSSGALLHVRIQRDICKMGERCQINGGYLRHSVLTGKCMDAFGGYARVTEGPSFYII